MKQLITADLIKNAKLFLGTLIAIIVTMAIVSACLLLAYSASGQANYGHRFEGVDIVVAPLDRVVIHYQTKKGERQDKKELEESPSFSDEQLSYLNSNYDCVLDYSFFVKAEELKYDRLAGHNESSMALSNFVLVKGKKPNAEEVVIDKVLAAHNKISVEDVIRIKTNRGTDPYIVSGIVDSDIDGIYSQQNYVFFEEATAVALSNGCINVGIITDDPPGLSQSLKQEGFRVYTGETINQGEVPSIVHENTASVIVFSIMGLLCLIISIFAMSGTVEFGVRHRSGNIALLRTLGLTKGQIVRILCAQSAILCVAGGIFGVLLSFPVTGLIRNVFLRIGIVSKYPAVFYPHPLLIDCIVFAAITVMVLIVTTFIANSLLSGPLISAGKEESGQPLTISTFRIAAGSALLFGGTAMLLLVSFNGRNGIGMSFLTSCFFLAGIIFFHR